MKMASGGGSGSRLSLSEPRKRATGHRLDSEDTSSLGSARLEDRPNNWDFSDWRPYSNYDTGKRIKKGNPEKEKEKEREREREMSMSISQESSPRGERKHHTPSTFPRTKVTPMMSSKQQRALENLRQHLSFSDAEEVNSTDGERNNERYRIRGSERLPNNTPLDLFSSRQDRNDVDSDRNSNVLKDETPDGNQIVGRLMQIRDYIKQASNMMDNLNKSSDPGDQGRANQLEQVIARLKEQESKYLDLLLHLSSAREEQLVRTASANIQESRQDSEESEVASLELDLQSDTTDNTQDDPRDNLRPQIEDRLGRHSDTEAEEPLDSSRSRTTESNTDVTLVAEPSPGSPTLATASALMERRERLECDLSKKNDQLEALRQQHDLLKKMLQQQEQLRALESRQAALLAIQQDAEKRLSDERAVRSVQGAGSADSDVLAAVGAANTVSSSLMDDGDTSSDSENVTKELKDLRRRLDYLKNIYDIRDQSENQSTNAESEASVMSLERRQLQDKLQDLQEKKQHMDKLLQELHSLRGQRASQITNDLDAMSASSSQVHLLDSITAAASANRTAVEGEELLGKLEDRKKLQKLQDVRGRLNQLRDLVQYYQSSSEFIHGVEDPVDDDEDSAQPTSGNYRDRDSFSEKLLKSDVLSSLTSRLNSERLQQGAAAASAQVDMAVQADFSDTDSRLSTNIAAWCGRSC